MKAVLAASNVRRSLEVSSDLGSPGQRYGVNALAFWSRSS